MNVSRLPILFLLLSLACQTKTSQRTDAPATTPATDSVALLSKRPGPDAPRSAADRLVRALYFEHNKTDNPFREKNRALIDQFFAKALADRIWKAGPVKPTGTNPLFNAPDKAIHKTWVEPAAVAGTRAVVYVTFLNAAKPQEIRLDLQQLAGRWRITDMLYPGNVLLSGLLHP